MIVGFGAQTHLLEFGLLLMLAGLAFFLALLVAKLAIVHQAADRRRGVGRHFDKVQVAFFGEALGLLDTDDTNLCPVLIDEPYFTGTNTVVDAKPISNCNTPLVY
jgi:hypothetical protein